MPPNSQMEMLSKLISDETDAVIEFTLVGKPFSASFLTIVADWDMDQVNLPGQWLCDSVRSYKLEQR